MQDVRKWDFNEQYDNSDQDSYEQDIFQNELENIKTEGKTQESAGKKRVNLSLDLNYKNGFGEFFVDNSNSDAFNWIHKDFFFGIVYGPKGSGKSHLSYLWLDKVSSKKNPDAKNHYSSEYSIADSAENTKYADMPKNFLFDYSFHSELNMKRLGEFDAYVVNDVNRLFESINETDSLRVDSKAGNANGDKNKDMYESQEIYDHQMCAAQIPDNQMHKSQIYDKQRLENQKKYEWQKNLFNFFNFCLISGKRVLFNSLSHISEWQFEFQDIESRLKSCSAIYLQSPSDSLLQLMIRRLFENYEIYISSEIVTYIFLHADRSFESIHSVVDFVVSMSCMQKRSISIGFIRELFSQM